ncbi:hypothetical protein V6R21_01375 [Limibacter armeniacum]|uniref:hypothetical protein n=1 Tax=Limibacter armeniacum TaxID=466084 RepID=UPI002FE54742
MDALTTVIHDSKGLKSLKQSYPVALKSITETGYNSVSENGTKPLIIIGIQESELSNTASGASGLNHEEVAHGNDIIKTDNKNSNAEDHLDYYGEKTDLSPDDDEVRTDQKYRNTEAKKQLDEIDKIIEDERNRK